MPDVAFAWAGSMSRAGSLHPNLPNLAFVHQNRRMNRRTDMWAYWSTVTANKRGWVTNQQTEWVTLSLIEQHDKDNAISQVAHCCQCQSEMEFSNEGLISTNLLPHLEDHELTPYCRYWENMPSTPTRLVFLIYPANTFLQQTLLLAWYSPNIHHKGR